MIVVGEEHKQGQNKFMYLKELYKVNKLWFVVVLCFIIVQLVMDAKQGASISPVFHYGMFSGYRPPQEIYSVSEIIVNGKLLQTKDFSPYPWAKIDGAATMFYTQTKENSHIWNHDVKRLLRIKDSSKYINNVSEEQFNVWYKKYLQGIIKSKVDSFSVNIANYVYNGQTLTKAIN